MPAILPRSDAHPGALAAGPLDPLPLADGWGLAQALAAYAAAAAALPMPLHAPEPLSVLSTVVLRSGDFVAKVYPPGTDAAHLAGLTAALAGSRSVVLPVSAPVVTPHGVVVVAPYHPAGPAVAWPAVGALLRRMHAEHADAQLPEWRPLRRLPAQVAGLDAADAEVLLRAREVLLDTVAGLCGPLGVGAIHGDVSPSNVLRTPAGPRLIDLDFAARGPREWDLASASRRHRSGELDREDYRRFCAAYGFDVETWDGLAVLDRLAELGGVAFRLWDTRRGGGDLGWLPAVLAQWRTPL